MKTYESIMVADADKLVRLEIPVEEASRRYRVTVVVEPEELNGQDAAGRDEWPAGFFERTAGKWMGELVRAPQGAFEQRATL